jgi:hypothetical protein
LVTRSAVVVNGSANRSDPLRGGGGTHHLRAEERVMSDDYIRRLDDTTLLLQRQAAADCSDEKRLTALDAEVIRRTALIRAQLGGGR